MKLRNPTKNKPEMFLDIEEAAEKDLTVLVQVWRRV